ncbi:MAG: ComF family protein [Flavobacteriaceae bacterium]|nr:ComF family protein [Flavobacteriaceae bacterium]
MQAFKDLYYLFFPTICQNCEEPLVQNEDLICIKCRFDLPLAEMTDHSGNDVENVFYGRVPIDFGTALLRYNRKGVVQKLIHQLKYKEQEELGTLFGIWLGKELAKTKRLPKIDYVLPVPIHHHKLRKRGYNQVTKFGQQIANEINAEFNEDQLRSISTEETQTLKQRIDRWKNVKEKFYLNDTSFFENKNVLLVDDVITTGATLEACCIELKKTKNITISIATIAFTS